jgi:hypothetical protein
MALHDRLFASLRNDLPGVTDALLTSKIWEVINEMCREGWVWKETIEVTLVNGDPIYSIAPTDTEVLYLYSISHETLDVNEAVFELGTLTLATAPTPADVAAGFLYAVVALAPTLGTGTDVEALIPQDMWSEHFETMRRGMLASMLALPAKPWTNPQLAAFYHRDFRSRLGQAKHKVQTAGVPGAQLWRFPKWA